MKIAAIFIGIFMTLNFEISHSSEMLNLLTMNVYMLPKPIHWSMQQKRTEEIVEQLKNTSYDFIFFQEAFMSSFRDQIAEKLAAEYPHNYYLNRSGRLFHIMGSGVFVLSRHPIKVLETGYFDSCSGFDCFASKGFVLFETNLENGSSLQFSTTHLQAGPENGQVRMKQLLQMKEALKKYAKKDVPQFLVGDLNIDFSDPEYQQGLDLMEMKYAPLSGDIKTTNARTNDCYTTPTKKLWIDHIWVDKNLPTEVLVSQVKDFSFKFEGKICPSSDHHGVEARLATNKGGLFVTNPKHGTSIKN
jgi:endonuclease/exonuclease/phosphatase family metal-dependent hydrolase